MWKWILDWSQKLAYTYHVNPVIFGSIYFGAIPFFTASVAWLVRNIKQKKSILLPALCTGLTFTSAYIYLIIVGKNVPYWVYIFMAVMIAYGIYSTVKKVQNRLEKSNGENS